MTTLVQLKHGYDQAGNRLYRRDEVARTNSASFDELYGYDDLNRLTSFDRGQLGSGNTSLSSGPTLNQGWTLDPLGNWSGFTQTVQEALTQTRAHNTTNEITDIDKTVGQFDWSVPVYDANGNTVRWPRPSSVEDEDLGVYDAWNRLVKIERGSTVAEYQYDGLNRQTVKVASSVTRHYYHSDQWQVLEERTGSNTTADRQYLWGERYVDDLIFRDHSSTRLYALTDALFNVVAMTDDDGAVVERFAYQPYGQSEELDPDFTNYSGTNYQWEYRFTGREFDLESGLQINRHRYLHQQLGRWLTRDPLAYRGGINLYRYLAGMPTIKLDSLGLRDPDDVVPWPGGPRPPVSGRPEDHDDYQEGGGTYPSGEGSEIRPGEFCLQFADRIEKERGRRVIITTPGEGHFRHCLAACCLTKRFGDGIGGSLIGIWDKYSERPSAPWPKGPDSVHDMAAEQSGRCVGNGDRGCSQGCEDALTKPGDPCAPIPLPPPKVTPPIPKPRCSIVIPNYCDDDPSDTPRCEVDAWTIGHGP